MMELVSHQKPSCDFRDVSLIPTVEDLFSKEVCVRPNLVHGAFASVNHYLDIQFHLLREDFFAPMREGIEEYMKNRESPKSKFGSIRIYRDVIFCGLRVSGDRFGIAVNFDPHKVLRDVNWRQTKRFMHGSLLCFTKNNFRTVIFGTVIRLLQESGIVIVNFNVGSDTRNNLLKDKDEYIMAESEVYFEPYYQVLKALKELNEHEFPMKRYIVEAQRKRLQPLYLIGAATFDNLQYSIMPDLKIDIIREVWPSHQVMGLDESQYKAFKLALTSDLAVIQGPPGTGKTFIGLKIAEALIHNCKFWNQNNQPMLVVCYTNHALDQFLEGILNYTQYVVRVGRQSKSEEIKHYGIMTWRREYAKRATNCMIDEDVLHFYNQIEKLKKRNKKIQSRQTFIFTTMKQIQHDMDIIQGNEGIVCLSSLVSHQVVDVGHHQCFEYNGKICESDFFEWLVPMSPLEVSSVDNTPVAIQSNSPKEKIEVDKKNDDLINDFESSEFEDDEIFLEYDFIISDYGKLKYSKTLEVFNSQKSLLMEKMNAVRLGEPEQYYKQMPELEKEYRQIVLTMSFLEKYLNDKRLPEQEHVDRVRAAVDIWKLNYGDRWILYRSWLNELREILLKAFRNEEKEFRYYTNQYAETRQLIDLEIMRKCLVVGMTTTGAARLQPLLKLLKPKIGDHKQLRPSTSQYRLAKYFKLDISLFERMLNNGMHCEILKVQHRMRPEIASLISPTIYPELENHFSVTLFEDIKGISRNVFFIDHNFPEKQSADSFSYVNVQEAEYLMALGRYLVLQGYEPQKITILCTYTAQMLYIKKEKQKFSQLKGVNITVVDSFQGEENDIILLSLVRNNTENAIGFLGTDNRVCVALSRAKKGLYIMGNSQILAKGSGTWMQILDILRERNAIGRALEVRCQVHSEMKMEVLMSEDFGKFLDAGCNLKCDTVLPCGHYCQAVCHKADRKHEKQKCLQICERALCAFGHICKKRCFEECGPCQETVMHQLPCGHLRLKLCHAEIEDNNCLVTVIKLLPGCGHPVEMPCCTDPYNYRCPYSCDAELQCGHLCQLACHVQQDPEHLFVVCRQACTRRRINCSRQHLCRRLCFEPCEVCEENVLKIIPSCGHKIELPCFMNAASVYCNQTCNKMLECGHRCKNKCFEDCNDCCKNVFKNTPYGQHTVMHLPYIGLPRNIYLTSSGKPLYCQPYCMSTFGRMCNQFCGPQNALSEGNQNHQEPYFMDKNLYEAHVFNCEQPPHPPNLDELPCIGILDCGHRCGGLYYRDCWQGRVHVPCVQKCNRILICGHKCKFPCVHPCPPCIKKCMLRCKHKKCDKRCGEPCTPCREPCEWKCEHYQCTKMCCEPCDRPPCLEPCKKLIEKCQHPCIGFCGEPCPQLCRICDKEVVGRVHQEDARFVYLEDCQHTVEVQYLEIWLKKSYASNGDLLIRRPTCPDCNTVISRNAHFSNLIIEQHAAICDAKKKLLDNVERMESNIIANIYFLKSLFKPTPGPFTAFSRELFLESSKYFAPYVWQLIESHECRKPESTRDVFNIMDMENLCVQVEIIKQVVKKTQLVIECSSQHQWIMRNQIDFIFMVLSNRSRRQLSNAEVHDLNLEIQRFYRIVDMCIQQSQVEYQFLTMRQQDIYARTVLKPLKCLKYTFSTDKEIADSQAQLNEILKISNWHEKVSRKNIFLSVGMRSGYWMKCTRGHCYYSTEICICPISHGMCNVCIAEGGILPRHLETYGLARTTLVSYAAIDGVNVNR